MIRIHLYPEFSGEDEGDGGIRRVVEAQIKTLSGLRVEFVAQNDLGNADLFASHITIPQDYMRRFPDKPFVAHIHGLYWSEYEWEKWSYKANREVLQAICTADATTAPTEWVAAIIRRHTSRDVRVIPHGVSCQEWQPPATPQPYILWNKTRPDPVCDPAAVIELARLLPDEAFVSTFGRESANLKIVGRMPFSESKKLTRHANLYLATTRETFGIGTLEAMACGIPIIGWNYGGQAEFVEHKKDGWLAEVGDYQSLAEGIRWAKENRTAAGRAAREKALKFTWAAAGKMYKDLYTELIERYEEMDERPRVTIVVPAYKLADFLPDTLDSIQKQTDRDWECIVVDDASPDACGEIADTYAATDERIRVIHNTENKYLAEARNIAIREARGRYILPVDADDQLAPHAVKLLADALDEDRTLSVAYGNVKFTEPDGRTPRNYGVAGVPVGFSGWPIPFDAWKQVQGANHLPYASMYRRSAWRQVGGYRRRLRTAEDADFWTRMASWGFNAQYVTGQETLIYRNREDSMSRVQDAHRYDYLRWFPWAKDAQLAPAGLAGEQGVSLLTPHISVVIPVGPGHELLVQDAVDSVSAQSYPYWECIVVNDSGVDLELPAWARVITSGARDPGAARNMGIAASRGELFLPLDADDYLQPDALQWLISAYVESEGKIIYPDFYEDPEKRGEFRPYALADFDCEYFVREGAMHSITALTPKAVWAAVGGYATYQNWEDWDFQLRCAAAGFCSTRIAAPLFTYRKWTGKRRDWKNGAEFEDRKRAILNTWDDYFQGRKRFMACGCQGGTIAPPQQTPMSVEMKQALAQNGDALLVEYTGRKAGSVRYRAPSGTIYSFAAGDPPKYVAGEDVPLFEKLADFRVIRTPKHEPQELGVPALAV